MFALNKACKGCLNAINNFTLLVRRNLTIQAATDTITQSQFYETKKSGLLSSGGIGFTVGRRQQSTDQQSTSTTAVASSVGSVGGNVDLLAGVNYKQIGSDVLTPTGDLSIAAQNLRIQEARETDRSDTKIQFKQSGLTLAVNGGILDTAQNLNNQVKGAFQDSNNRNKTLHALQAYAQGSDLMAQGKNVMAATQGGGASGAAAASGIKISLSYGQSTSESHSSTLSNTGLGSLVKAGGDVTIQATANNNGNTNANAQNSLPLAQRDLTVQGSRLSAGKNISLSAADEIQLLTAQNTASQHSTNKSSSGSIGVSIGTDGLMLNLAASGARGKADGDDVTWTNTQIEAGERLTLNSGGDTTLHGAVTKGEQIIVNVGTNPNNASPGKLTIESLQDTSQFDSKQQSLGGSLSVGYGKASGNLSASQSKINSTYASVTEQSGLQAGDGGFQVSVANQTQLTGAVIASSEAAVQNNQNRLNTQTLTTTDLQNRLNASASSSGLSVGTSLFSSGYEAAKGVAGNVLNNASAKQSDASTTKSAISGAQVTAGNQSTDTRQTALTDSSGKAVSSDTTHTHRTLTKADVAALQQQVQQQQSDKMLVLNTATAFTDEAYRTLYQAGAQLYKVPPGCGDKSCAVPLSEQEALTLKTSQDGKVHIANNGIFNDLDGAVKYAQQHGGTMNTDGSKDYSAKPENQYIIFTPQSNNVLSEDIVAVIAKSGLTPSLGLTNAEQKTANLIQQTTQQGQSLVLDNHSRGALTTDNAMRSLNNQGGIRDTNGNLLIPNIQMNNYGSAKNLTTGNQTLQQLTSNPNAQINSVIHTQDLVGTATLVGNNPATPTYTSTAADGTQSVVKVLGDRRWQGVLWQPGEYLDRHGNAA